MFAALLGALVAAGCATTRPIPYLVSADGIGVGVVSPPTSETAMVTSNWIDAEGPALDAMRNVPGGVYTPLAPLALIFAPFAMASDTAVCDQKLAEAYPGLAQKFSEIVQREFSAAEVQDKFVAVLQEGTKVPLAREEISYGNDASAGE